MGGGVWMWEGCLDVGGVSEYGRGAWMWEGVSGCGRGCLDVYDSLVWTHIRFLRGVCESIYSSL